MSSPSQRPVTPPTGTRLPAGGPAGTGGGPRGSFASLDGEDYYRIADYPRLAPFLMSVPSDTDLWMFLTSGGGLTAGRVDADSSLFPYETVDRLHDGHHHTGPLSLFRVEGRGEAPVLWRLFHPTPEDEGRAERNLYKNVVGNRVVFEEIRTDLGLVFRYRWTACDELGFVRTATLINRGAEPVWLDVLDGLRNVLPSGVPLALQQQSSSLVDAYKRADRDPDTGMGIYSLTSRIVDRPEAAEALRATTVWCHGLPDADVALSLGAVEAFVRGERAECERTLTGRRGNYLVRTSLELAPGARRKWHLMADVQRSHAEISRLRARILDRRDLDGEIEARLAEASEGLVRNVASADGLQRTAHPETTAHHFANVLFNNMRGGVFDRDHEIDPVDFRDFLAVRNRPVAERHRSLLADLAPGTRVDELLTVTERTEDADLQRLAHEYLPLHFGRRHGDPSRPWNRFAIQVRNGDGTRALRYEGNWRDVFQNWEALASSFPRFLPGLVAKFVNASTPDGFNPYRITRAGVDWEIPDPEDPWSHVGYWGDHQIVYLLRLLEALARSSPGSLESLLERPVFSYANVPYRIAPYEELLEDPRETIRFDRELERRIEARVDEVGTDGKLLTTADGAVLHVTLLEKLLVPALSKISNLVPEGGIWMNTQRPEWNDANNALAGDGLSMVTVYHLQRYLSFLDGLLRERRDERVTISLEVARWLRQLHALLRDTQPRLQSGRLGPADRKELLDGLGRAFSEYRAQVYADGLSGQARVDVKEIRSLCRAAATHLEHTIDTNRREDGLYHSYNLMELSADRSGIAIGRLPEMLEGQVAALGSDRLDPTEAIRVLTALFDSALYHEKHGSFVLYPEKELPAFLEKNVVPDERVRSVPLLAALLEAGDGTLLARDALGVFRFHGDIRHAADVAAVLDRVAAREGWADAVARDRDEVLALFEEVFDHRSFTGRSGSMYGYEGLGCVYWHMVAKLLLAVQEIARRADHDRQPAAVREALARAYYRVRAGLGFNRTVEEYGAFPTDPYSHTPPQGGARQPGMTGQVKEEILTRFGELGVLVEGGAVRFRPVLLRPDEFLGEPAVFAVREHDGGIRDLDLAPGSLAFTYCQVPVVYSLTEGETTIRVTDDAGATHTVAGDALGAEWSRMLLDRRGGIARIDVAVPESVLCRV